MRYDFVVIGSGISGLTSAVILARQGFSVALVEKAPLMAPVLRGFSRQGIHFDTGFHYTGGLEEGGILQRFFNYLGIAPHIEKYPFNGECFDLLRYTDSGEDFAFLVGYESLREKLCSAIPQEREAIDSYLAMVRQTLRRLPYLCLEGPMEELTSMGTLAGVSLQDVLNGLTKDPHLKQVLSLHTLLHGVAPNEVPFAIHAGVAGLYYKSVHGVVGGGKAIVEAFRKRLTELGVKFFPGRGAQSFEIGSQGRIAGVRLEDGELLESDQCISTVHPSVLLDLVPEGSFRPVYRRRLASLEETVSAFTLYAAFEEPTSFLHRTNLFITPRGGDSRGASSGHLEDRTFYLAGTALTENEEGGKGFVAICPADKELTERWKTTSRGRRPVEYLRYKDELVERMQRHIERNCPELEGRFRVLDSGTPLTIGDFSGNPRQGLYGVKHKVGQFNPMPATKLPGLFLAGQAVGAPGVLGGMLSGFLACGTILGHDRLRKEVRECS